VFRCEFLPVHFDVEQVRREVVTRVLEVVFDLLGEVRVDGIKKRTSDFGFEVDEIEHHVDEIAELIFVLGREPEHLGNHAGRDVLGVLVTRVDLGSAPQAVEVLLTQGANLGLEGIDRSRREGR